MTFQADVDFWLIAGKRRVCLCHQFASWRELVDTFLFVFQRYRMSGNFTSGPEVLFKIYLFFKNAIKQQ